MAINLVSLVSQFLTPQMVSTLARALGVNEAVAQKVVAAAVPAILEEDGVDEVRWERPVRPGDRLHVRRHTLAKRPGEGGRSEGEVEFLYEVINQEGVVAMTQRSLLLLEQRPLLLGN